MLSIVRFLRALLGISRDIQFSFGKFLLVILTGILSGLASVAILAMITQTLTSPDTSQTWQIWAFAALCIVIPIIGIASQALLLRLGNHAITAMRINLSERILDAEMRGLEQLGKNRLLATITDDTEGVADSIINLPRVAMQLTILIGGLIYLGWLSLPVLGGMVVFMILAILAYRMPLIAGIRKLRLFREEWDTLMQHMQALTEGTKELKLHRSRRKAFMEKRIRASTEAQARYSIGGHIYFAIATNLAQVLYFIAIGLVLFAMPRLTNVEPNTMIGYAVTILYLRGPMESLLNLLPSFGAAKVAIDKVRELGLSLEQAQVTGGQKALPPAQLDAQHDWRSLELRGVSYEYQSETQESFAIGPVDLSLRPGEVVFLIGGNGSGKTTLAKVLIGLYPPDEGSIDLNGETITDGQRDDYRQLFTVVFSDFYLFDSLLGLEADDLDERAMGYLEKLHLQDKVKVEDGNLSTIDLSQGQRKRLALLTAYMEDRPIYMFDEWAADQDPYFKQVFYRTLLPELKERGKTVVVISHDDHYYDVGDRVIKMNDGKVEYDVDIEQFRARAQGSMYAELYEKDQQKT